MLLSLGRDNGTSIEIAAWDGRDRLSPRWLSSRRLRRTSFFESWFQPLDCLERTAKF
jgi:hypothetical protein